MQRNSISSTWAASVALQVTPLPLYKAQNLFIILTTERYTLLLQPGHVEEQGRNLQVIQQKRGLTQNRLNIHVKHNFRDVTCVFRSPPDTFDDQTQIHYFLRFNA
jgi:hypothetical protein